MEKAFNRGLLYVHQLCDEGKVISTWQASERYSFNLMEFNGIISAILKGWKWEGNRDEEESLVSKLSSMRQVSRYAYQELNGDVALVMAKVRKWEVDLNMDIPIGKFLDCFRDINNVTNIIKYHSFQYRLLQ